MNDNGTKSATKTIFIPERYNDVEYRQWMCALWMEDVIAARLALANINDAPYYGSPACANGWRVD